MENLANLPKFLAEYKFKTIHFLDNEAKNFMEALEVEVTALATSRALAETKPLVFDKNLMKKNSLLSAASFSALPEINTKNTLNEAKHPTLIHKSMKRAHTFHVNEEKMQLHKKDLVCKRKTGILENLQKKVVELDHVLMELELKLITLSEDLSNRLNDQSSETAALEAKSFGVLLEEWRQDQKKSLLSAKEFIKAIEKMPEALVLEALQSSYITLQAMPLILYKRALQLVIHSKVLLLKEGGQIKENEAKWMQEKLRREKELEEFDLFLQKEFANPYRPCFSQEKISPCFGETQNAWTANLSILGRSVREVGEEIRQDNSLETRSKIAAGAFFLPKYRCWTTMNNRALCAAAISEKEMFRFYIQFPSAEMLAFFKSKEEKILKHSDKCTFEALIEKFFIVLFEKGKLGELGRTTVSVPKRWLGDSLQGLSPIQAREVFSSFKQVNAIPSFFKNHFTKKSLEPEQLARELEIDENKDEQNIAELQEKNAVMNNTMKTEIR